MSPYVIPGVRVKFNDLQGLVCICAQACGISYDEFFETSRKRHRVFARYLFYEYAMNKLGFGCVRLANFMGQDHTTVLHAVKTMKDLRDTGDAELKECEDSFKRVMIGLDPLFVAVGNKYVSKSNKKSRLIRFFYCKIDNSYYKTAGDLMQYGLRVHRGQSVDELIEKHGDKFDVIEEYEPV